MRKRQLQHYTSRNDCEKAVFDLAIMVVQSALDNSPNDEDKRILHDMKLVQYAHSKPRVIHVVGRKEA